MVIIIKITLVAAVGSFVCLDKYIQPTLSHKEPFILHTFTENYSLLKGHRKVRSHGYM